MTTTHAAARLPPPRFRIPHVLTGGIAVGTFDLVFACTWWAIAANVPPLRIFQSIAAGVYGRASFDGGLQTAAVGGVAHYFIATCMVAAFAFAASRVRSLRLHPWRWGVAYGLFLYVVMTCVVVPLSAAPQNRHPLSWVLASIVVHGLIGVACALIARNAINGRRNPGPSVR